MSGNCAQLFTNGTREEKYLLFFHSSFSHLGQIQVSVAIAKVIAYPLLFRGYASFDSSLTTRCENFPASVHTQNQNGGSRVYIILI